MSFLSAIKGLFAFNNVSRPWHMPIACGITIGAPAVLGAMTGTFTEAMIASLGSMVFLYLGPTQTTSRMLTMILCSFGFMACLTVATLSVAISWMPPIALLCIAFTVTLITRYYKLPPPGSFFFILASCIAMAMPYQLSAIPERVGLIAIGGMWAVFMAFLYSLLTGGHRLEKRAQEIDPRVNAIILESLFLSLVVAGSYGFALWLELNNPYWVPISCAAILQGATFRIVWHRNVHRIGGTIVGMFLASALFSFHPNALTLAIAVVILQTIVEVFIIKNYGLAVIFITPLTVIMAEITSSGIDAGVLLEHRLIDIVLGSCIGFVGGTIFHRSQFLSAIEKRMEKRNRLSELLFPSHSANAFRKDD